MNKEILPLSLAAGSSTKSPNCFSAVVEAHWTAVYRLLHSMTGNPHDSEDLTQETFLRALKRWETYQQGTNLRAWLLRIASNAFFDANRRKQNLKMNPLPEDLQEQGIAAESALERLEQGELIRAAVQELTELTRLVFHLRVSEELSFKEIAELAGISEVAARQHMHQARLKLLKRLGEPSD